MIGGQTLKQKLITMWNLYNIQIIGALLMIVAFILALFNNAWGGWIILAIIGAIDIYLIYWREDWTVTKWIRNLTGHRIDNIIMIGLIILCWALKGELIALWFTLGLLNNHFFERQ